MIKFK